MSEDTLKRNETDTYQAPGEIGHNKEVVWERWQKKRTFVRALEGTYGEVYKDLFAAKRVYSSTDWKWKGGPHNYGKKIINPQSVNVAQSIECHLDAYAPGGYGQKHGHMNSAVFYIITGKGKDIHDGKEMIYEAGDSLVVENGCVHQHINRGDEEMLVLVMKAKPLFLFMHMIFQKMVEYPSKDVPPGGEDYAPPTHI
jgi:mannose-6-phosphate isomerase-like protein (cupin superfamily)